MTLLEVVTLGTHQLANPFKDEPPFLSAASGTVWAGTKLYSVGDDQAAVAEYQLPWTVVQEALRTGAPVDFLQPGTAQRIIPDVLPPSGKARSEAKPDFEALTMMTPVHFAKLEDAMVRDEAIRRFPYGFLFFAGSGGMSYGGNRRSIGVISSLDRSGHIIGLPTKIRLDGLHEYLEEQVVGGKLNIEGICVDGSEVLMAQRGNSLSESGEEGQNMLITLMLEDVLRSLFSDLCVDRCEVRDSKVYDLGRLDLHGHQVKLDFTDLDAVADDPRERFVFTAAAEGLHPEVDGEIAGSVVGVIDPYLNIIDQWPLADPTIKLEGINGSYNPTTGTIDVLLVADADDPLVPAPLMAARLPEH